MAQRGSGGGQAAAGRKTRRINERSSAIACSRSVRPFSRSRRGLERQDGELAEPSSAEAGPAGEAGHPGGVGTKVISAHSSVRLH